MAPSTAPRQPYLFCPVLRRALCSGSRASRVSFAWVLRRAEWLFGGAQGAPKRLGGTALKASALPTCAFPHVLSHLTRWVGCRLKFRACI